MQHQQIYSDSMFISLKSDPNDDIWLFDNPAYLFFELHLQS